MLFHIRSIQFVSRLDALKRQHLISLKATGQFDLVELFLQCFF